MRGLTFELSWDRRCDARPARRRITKAASRAWRHAVGPQLERGVRHRGAGACDWLDGGHLACSEPCEPAPRLRTTGGRVRRLMPAPTRAAPNVRRGGSWCTAQSYLLMPWQAEKLEAAWIAWKATTGVPCMPNVRAKLPAKAGAVSLVRDDAPSAADQAYSACRSGSA